MGVKGLHSFMESSEDVLKLRLFRESILIVDGSSLYYSIYFNSHLDQAHGGDYSGFERLVKTFFRNLRSCQIVPYVLIDGGDDVSGKKFETLKTRTQERIRRANTLSLGRSGEVLPGQSKIVFMQILRKLGVPFIQCLAEADWEAAALANEWNCPVLSNDSDFYIFGNKGGFLPINHFQWRKLSTIKGTTNKFIYAKWFGFKNLCSAYNSMTKNLLPLFAIILGNDYIQLNQFKFPNWAKFSSKPGAASKVDGVLVWLSRYPSPKEAIAALLSPMGKNRHSANLQGRLYEGMEDYILKPSSIAQFFLSGRPQTRPPGPLQNLPDWTLKPLAEGKLHYTIIEVLTLQRIMLNIQVEDFSLSSSHETSKLIRQVVYGLLLCTRRQDASGGSRFFMGTDQHEVEEYDRKGLKLISTMVPAVLPRCAVTHLYLDTLWKAPRHLRLQVLSDTLCVAPGPNFQHVPKNLQLAVYVTCYWLKHARPEPKAETFWALLIGLVYGELCRGHPNNKEVAPVITRLKSLQSRKGKRKILDLELAHAYSQWQSCLKNGFILSQLLNHPVPEPQLAWLYCGTLVHGAAQELRKGIDPGSLLCGDSFATKLYGRLRAAVKETQDQDLIARMMTRSEPSKPQESQEPVEDLTRKFKHLMHDQDELETDEDQSKKNDVVCEQSCRVRTRHKTKRRTREAFRMKKSESANWQ